MKKISMPLTLVLMGLVLLSACSAAGLEGSSPDENSSPASETAILDDVEASSEENGEPDYSIVFPQDAVNEITIQISSENWQLMMDDMTGLYGEQGAGQGSRANFPGQRQQDEDRPALPEGDQLPEGDRPAIPEAGQAPLGRQPGQRQPGAGMPGGNDDSNPIWVEAEISFSGQVWEHIGIRFKGNSSLKSTWSSGSLKLPFKLDFDQYEDDYPETEDQRFYGFKQLSFASNFQDDSFLREKVAADIFREAGVPSAQTAFYAVSIDYGEGPVYLGLYTAVEVIDDTVIETQFSDDDGNVYKPEGAGATFAAGSFSEASFDKETNQDEDDYSDILALYDALHDPSRLSDPESWREILEEIFDVDTFLNWLAVNTVIQNWDTYGGMSHNYYLYNNPESGQLTWIPWDNNESLKAGGGMRDSIPLDLATVGDNWPLISYLRDDPVYYQKYLQYLELALEEVIDPEDLSERFQYYHDLLASFVESESQQNSTLKSLAAFESSVSELSGHIQDRVSQAESFLAAER